jgi:hypothetical protein
MYISSDEKAENSRVHVVRQDLTVSTRRKSVFRRTRSAGLSDRSSGAERRSSLGFRGLEFGKALLQLAWVDLHLQHRSAKIENQHGYPMVVLGAGAQGPHRPALRMKWSSAFLERPWRKVLVNSRHFTQEIRQDRCGINRSQQHFVFPSGVCSNAEREKVSISRDIDPPGCRSNSFHHHNRSSSRAAVAQPKRRVVTTMQSV